MKHRMLIAVTLGALAPAAAWAQTVGTTSTLAPLAGPLYTPASGQSNIGFYGTDLGATFTHGTGIRVLFGDTWANLLQAPIGIGADDSLGVISLSSFATGDAVDAYVATHPPGPGELSWQREGPPVVFRTNFFGKVAPIPLYRGGTGAPLLMDVFRVPLAGFSNARTGPTGAAFAIFYRRAPMACTVNACSNGFTCDTGVGMCAGGADDNTIPCVLGTQRCSCVAVSGGGYCQDRTSSVYDGTEDGRTLSVALRNEVGNADPNVHEQHYTKSWYTNKFMNPSVRTVENFDPARANGVGNNYAPANGAAPTANEKVFLWGRPGFAGLGAPGRDAQLYFAYVDMPTYSAQGNFAWTPRYFTGQNGSGVPQFSTSQAAATPLDLGGGSPVEQYDIVNFHSISWVPGMNKWVMLYGGDLPPSVLSFLLGPNGTQAVRDPEGAIHARFAAQPWGPWSAPVQVLVGGAPGISPPLPGTQYASGGILHHPGCSESCAPAEPSLVGNEGYGRLYFPNIVDPWTMNRGGGAHDLYWNVSTWAPYQSVLMKTRINQ